MKRAAAKKSAPARRTIDPALKPFLDEIAAMITAQLLAEHQQRAQATREQKVAA